MCLRFRVVEEFQNLLLLGTSAKETLSLQNLMELNELLFNVVKRLVHLVECSAHLIFAVVRLVMNCCESCKKISHRATIVILILIFIFWGFIIHFFFIFRGFILVLIIWGLIIFLLIILIIVITSTNLWTIIFS